MTQQAKGIKDRSNYGNLQALRTDVPLTLVRQLHNSHVAGKHTDLRIGNNGGMFSWALPKDLPEQRGDKRLAITQPLHSWSYNDFEGTIGKGYGSGTVRRLEKSPVVIVENTPNKITFTRGSSRGDTMYTMRRTRNGNWIVMVKGPDVPLTVSAYKKEHFRSVPLEKVADLMDGKAYATPKLDGAGALASIGGRGIRVFGIRPDKDGNTIEYTDHIGGLRGVDIPKELEGLLLRGEVVATRDGKVLPPQETSGFLNSALIKAAARRVNENVRLKMAPLAVVGPSGDEYDPGKVSEIVRKLGLPQFMEVPRYGKAAALEALRRMKEGTHPLTSEGLVIQRPGERPVKAKLTEDSDVVIRRIFPAATSDGSHRAGGFEYSLPGSDEIVGRVGTGFSHELLRDMLDNPGGYVGRTARIRHLGQYDSGAYRAPGFVSMKED